jgi:hypothetical protein
LIFLAEIAALVMTEIQSSTISPTLPSNHEVQPIDFSNTPLSKDCSFHYAYVISNFLTPLECTHLLSIAKSSTSPPDTWTPATIKSGHDSQSVSTEARSCGRIFHRAPNSLPEALLARLKAALPEIIHLEPGTYPHTVGNFKGGKEGWMIERLDPNFRFLRYSPGQFFKEHCDAMFVDKEAGERSFFTVHLYLNGGSEADDEEAVEGGATAFHSMNLKGKLDVEPVLGRALVFQQRGLLHSGAEVVKGVKYSMRTDVIYRKV